MTSPFPAKRRAMAAPARGVCGVTGATIAWSITELAAEITAAWLIFHFAFGLPLVPAFITATIVRLSFVTLEIFVFAVLYSLLSLLLCLYECFFERKHSNSYD